jgi:putative tryptophan/tyrosine transport system substrate-binding protein
VKRREFIGLLGGAAGWPLAARGQQPTNMRRIGALFSTTETDSEGQARLTAFRRGLTDLAWIEGRNYQVETRWAGGSADLMRANAAELVDLAPDVILAAATTALVALQRATRTIPIVFAQVTDPVAAGFVQSLARPGGNITGLTQHEFTIGVKWVELLKEFAPQVTRVGVLYDPENPTTAGYLQTMEAAALSVRMQLFPLPVRNRAEVAKAIDGLPRNPDSGLVLLPGPVGAANRDIIITLADRHRLPAVYPFRYHVLSGGLASYGVDNVDLYRRCRLVRRSNSKRRNSGRVASAACNKVRAHDQPEDRQGAWPRAPDHAAGPHRRGDRMRCCLLVAGSRTATTRSAFTSA